MKKNILIFFRLKEKNASNDDGKEAYSKPYFLAICVKYMEKFYKPMNFLENNKEEKYDELVEKISFETFRISRTTTFKDLKNQAGDFWVLILNYMALYFLNIITVLI